jgi:hypothetical protein
MDPSAVIACGAYDQDRVHDAVVELSAEAAVVVPPRSTAVLRASLRAFRMTSVSHFDRRIVQIGGFAILKPSFPLFGLRL